MLNFTHSPQKYPETITPAIRKENFNEIYQKFAIEQAQQQAARCSQCGVPFCQVHCPLQNNIPDWLKLVAEDRLQEAYEISSATNNFPEICGRICPQDRLCEGNCVIEKDFGSVTIGAVESFITENAWEQGFVQPIKPATELNLSIGIVGSGPAGLAAAEMLRRKGWQVTIYERADKAGGLLMYGIPNFKLEKWVVQRRIDWLQQGGIKFATNIAVGKDIGLQELRKKHNAVLLATGVYKPRDSDIAPSIAALDYLIANNRDETGALHAGGKKIVVIGGGDTAMDCVRTAIRAQAASVTCLYRRDRENMPGSAREVKNAEEEGVNFIWLAAPKQIMGNKIQAIRMQLNGKDLAGRSGISEIMGSEFELEADMVISALGFSAEDLPVIFNEPDLKTHADGRVIINNFATSVDGVYAAGDIARGASLVVWAIKDGRDAAAAIHNACTAPSPSGRGTG